MGNQSSNPYPHCSFSHPNTTSKISPNPYSLISKTHFFSFGFLGRKFMISWNSQTLVRPNCVSFKSNILLFLLCILLVITSKEETTVILPLPHPSGWYTYMYISFFVVLIWTLPSLEQNPYSKFSPKEIRGKKDQVHTSLFSLSSFCESIKNPQF